MKTNPFVLLYPNGCYLNNWRKFCSIRLHSNARTTRTLGASAHLFIWEHLMKTQNFSRTYQDLRKTGNYATIEGHSVLWSPLLLMGLQFYLWQETPPEILQPIWAAGLKLYLHWQGVFDIFPGKTVCPGCDWQPSENLCLWTCRFLDLTSQNFWSSRPEVGPGSLHFNRPQCLAQVV